MLSCTVPWAGWGPVCGGEALGAVMHSVSIGDEDYHYCYCCRCVLGSEVAREWQVLILIAFYIDFWKVTFSSFTVWNSWHPILWDFNMHHNYLAIRKDSYRKRKSYEILMYFISNFTYLNSMWIIILLLLTLNMNYVIFDR